MSGEGEAPRPSRKRGRRKAPRELNSEPKREPKRAPKSNAQKVREAVKLLSEVAESRAQALGVPRLTPFMVDFHVGGARAEREAQVKRLERQLTERARAQVPTQWRRGRVYCFERDEAVEPPERWSVFDGHDLLGRPQWTTLTQLCLRGDPEELTALSQEPPLPTTHLHTDLSAYVLESVRAGRLYDVLAQLVVGPISERFTPVTLDEERRVFTAQVVLSQPEGLPLQLRVNLLGLDESELFDGAARCAPRAPLAQATHALQRAQQRARKLERALQQGGVVGPELTRQAERLLSELRASLKRALSAHKHKTQHAQQRHHEMERPTSHARQDALSAGEERLFLDAHRDTIVAVGPKGRAHVFSDRGAHVTSLRLGVGELERKIGQGRWRPLEPERASAFKEALRRS